MTPLARFINYLTSPRARVPLVLTVAWAALLLVPFIVVGESWGMLWYQLTWKLSEWLKPMWEYCGPAMYVGVVTGLHCVVVFSALSIIGPLNNLMRGLLAASAPEVDKDDNNTPGTLTA